ncbi:putative toxin-antitoxin system toxin component, PIN family [Desulfosarcina sp. BuS5]|uniref:putative toxin-antitoxin system toxin component, PIN family n=1 Tax=Desulfosarcina sp. BuS5 TaxID=933262 RepID=UPI0018DB3CC0|nr:putative toxin-antitoxin system toxin component, PIN family [Desulfosarcina sp. BuS5]
MVLCLSQEIIEEYLEALNRLSLKDKKEIANLTGLFAEVYNSIFTTKTPNIKVVDDDPDDNKFLECAVALDSKIIISGDKHLKEIKKYIDIEIVPPKEFIDLYSGKNFH